MKKDSGLFLLVCTMLGLVCGFSLSSMIQPPDASVQAAGYSAAIASSPSQPWAGQAAAAWLTDQAFTYQGVLRKDGNPVNGECMLQFSLWDRSTAGTQIGIAQVVTVPVQAGQFTAVVNNTGQFSAAAFNGEARWLELTVKCPAASGNFIPITPRQPIFAAPLASGLVPHAEIKSEYSSSIKPVLKISALDSVVSDYPNGLWVSTDTYPTAYASGDEVGVWSDSVDGAAIKGSTDTGTAFWGVAGANGKAAKFEGNVEITGKLFSRMSSQSALMGGGPLPLTSSFASSGGTLMIFFSGSGFSNANEAHIGMYIKIDDQNVGAAEIFANNSYTHQSFMPGLVVLDDIGAGGHTIQLYKMTPFTETDSNDAFNVVVLELPY